MEFRDTCYRLLVMVITSSEFLAFPFFSKLWHYPVFYYRMKGEDVFDTPKKRRCLIFVDERSTFGLFTTILIAQEMQAFTIFLKHKFKSFSKPVTEGES